MYTRNVIWGLILILVGCFFLIEEFTHFDFGRYFWPIVLIFSGGLMLLKNYLKTNHHTD
ncbi:hypothetical protein CLV98_108142 [Dyadobacter jejuensis]|uniref:LiaI-LiaF-like transmembrane region domain-containing protein n=1 Tax=Dyadobacter jejuensis TaxID=1082580 RepID=A0A316AHR5_9BACT|nr:DUF5668 domain-containing protein [Dyadobacter jejuensis]PWJ57222.1 hypothetical protein CLV98_108142 [Dyadobacter jejuensis]